MFLREGKFFAGLRGAAAFLFLAFFTVVFFAEVFFLALATGRFVFGDDFDFFLPFDFFICFLVTTRIPFPIG